uniref:Protein yippee-like n=1 Tax=Cyprinus carpio carpio TaxID=630221 RepID=A0A9J7YHM5_CYPCA
CCITFCYERPDSCCRDTCTSTYSVITHVTAPDVDIKSGGRAERKQQRELNANKQALDLKRLVVNLQYSEVQDRVMLTGRHMVRDVSCKNCNSKLGWIYEFATEDSQRYKEGRVILERALVRESEGFEEHVPSDAS